MRFPPIVTADFKYSDKEKDDFLVFLLKWCKGIKNESVSEWERRGGFFLFGKCS